jgi:hypothetical protein
MHLPAGAWRAACYALVLGACNTEAEPFVAPKGDAAGDEATAVAEPSISDCQDGTSCSTPGLTCEGFLGERCCALGCTCGVNDVWVCEVSCNPGCEGPVFQLDAGDSGRADVVTDAALDGATTDVSDAPADVLAECSADTSCE